MAMAQARCGDIHTTTGKLKDAEHAYRRRSRRWTRCRPKSAHTIKTGTRLPSPNCSSARCSTRRGGTRMPKRLTAQG